MSRPRNVIQVDQVPWDEVSRGNRFEWRRRTVGAAAGGAKLGCSLYELAPGRRSWPYHYHFANEEAIYVLQGSGTLRLDGREIPVAAGYYVALPVGETGAHQVINTSEKALRYLCVSTMIEPEVSVYPDSEKVLVMTGSAPGGPKEERTLTAVFPSGAALDYWEGEE